MNLLARPGHRIRWLALALLGSALVACAGAASPAVDYTESDVTPRAATVTTRRPTVTIVPHTRTSQPTATHASAATSRPPTVAPSATLSPVPQATSEPLLPPRTPVHADARRTPDPSPPTPANRAELIAVPAATLTVGESHLVNRLGLVGNPADVEPAVAAGLRFGNFVFWRTSAGLPAVPGVSYWQTVRLGQVGDWGEWPAVAGEMERVLRERPGSYWLVGNEPDVRWQDNVTASEYAEAYHDIYEFIKTRDPSARVAAGGIAQPSPLRLSYLDDVLAHYRARYGRSLPADLWHIHAFTLREEKDGWGVGIPPGMDDVTGELFEITDHGDVAHLQRHVAAFRGWMASQGYADSPLAVTEFGILFPADLGYPTETVEAYLRAAFDFLTNETGEAGLQSDGGRLVQHAFWYSLNDPDEYTTGNLFDTGSGRLTRLGRVYQSYIRTLLAGTHRREPD